MYLTIYDHDISIFWILAIFCILIVLLCVIWKLIKFTIVSSVIFAVVVFVCPSILTGLMAMLERFQEDE